MIFSDKIYPRPVVKMILNREKTQTRRLVKEGEFSSGGQEGNYARVHSKNKKIKWQVGKTYGVQLGRGKEGIYYQKLRDGRIAFCEGLHSESVDQEPLLIHITAIRKERLCDITEEDAKKEGFKDKDEFLRSFMKISWDIMPVRAKKFTSKKLLEQAYRIRNPIAAKEWNPEVWVLEW